MPMILDRLLALTSDLCFAPSKMIVVGDFAPVTWRQLVADRFGIGFSDVMDVYGSTEIGAIAYYDVKTNLYHFHSHILPEVVDPCVLYEDCDSESRGMLLLLTSLEREYFPAIRFVTSDIVSGFREIHVDGKRVFAYSRLEGRFGGEIKYGERISHHDICSIMSLAFPNTPYEISNDGSLDIKVAATEISQTQADNFRRVLFRTCPDVARMLQLGLVGEYRLIPVPPVNWDNRLSKRRFTLRRTVRSRSLQ
jgi:phenylacetate-coenzyme A ligase PaaK-like adenylate-forming protein